MSAFGPKQTSLVAPHMSAFGGKADMAFCGCLLSRSLLGVKRTCLFAPHMSASDPKRTSSPTKNQRRLKEKSNSSSSLLSVRRLSAAGRHNARDRQPSQNRRQLFRHLNRMGATSCQNGDHHAYTHWGWPKVFALARHGTHQRCRINRHALAYLLYVGPRSRDFIALDFARD
jgi:hypothetical protein